jgi:hypothetical protein
MWAFVAAVPASRPWFLGLALLFWPGLFTLPVVPPIDPQFLSQVHDAEPIGTISRNEGEAEAYCDALRKAFRTPPAVFARHGRRDLTYADLFNEPARYRGQNIHLEGRLVRLRRLDAPLTVAEVGARDLYEGWIFDQRFRNNLWCVLFLRLPAGILVGERIDYPVSFDGYSFKRYRYKAGDSLRPEEGREVPLLIGPTVTLLPTAADRPNEPPAAAEWLPTLLIILVGMLILVGGLGWWYRRSDRKVRERLALLKPGFVEPGPQDALRSEPRPSGSAPTP